MAPPTRRIIDLGDPTEPTSEAFQRRMERQRRVVDLGDPTDSMSEAYRRKAERIGSMGKTTIRITSPEVARDFRAGVDERDFARTWAEQYPDLPYPNTREDAERAVAMSGALSPQAQADFQEGARERYLRWLERNNPSGPGFPGVMGNFASSVSDLSRIASPGEIELGPEEPIDGGGMELGPEEPVEGIPNSPPVPSGPVGGLDATGAPWYQRDVQRTEGTQNEGFLQGLSDPLGMGAEIYGASQMMNGRTLPELFGPEARIEYRQARDAREAELQRARETMEGFGLGRGAYIAPMLLAPPTSLAGMVGAGATMGALQGAGDAPPGQATRGAATGGAVGAATSLVGGLAGKGISAIGQRGAGMASRAGDKLLEGALSRGPVTPAVLQQLRKEAMTSGAQQALGGALVGGAVGGLFRPGLSPAAAIANIERLAKSSPEVALAWGSLMAKLRVVNPGQLAAWMSVLGRAASPEEFMATYEQLQAQDGQQQMQAMP